MSKKKVVLGRGLGALLGNTPDAPSKQEDLSNTGQIALEQITFNPFQPRKHFNEEALEGLAESIRTHGVIQPITVKRLSNDRYQLIAGERRVQASRLAGLKAVPAHIRTADDQQLLEMALIENIQRENLNPIEVALSYQRLISEINLKQEELGQRVGKKRSTVTNYLRLLKLPPTIQAALRDQKISMGHARPLIALDHVDHQFYIFNKILSGNLSVRQAESLVQQVLARPTRDAGAHTGTKEKINTSKEAYDIAQLQTQLSSHFGTKVAVNLKGKKGEIRLPFASVSDLNRILEILDIQ